MVELAVQLFILIFNYLYSKNSKIANVDRQFLTESATPTAGLTLQTLSTTNDLVVTDLK